MILEIDEIHIKHDRETGLIAIIALDKVNEYGACIGGTRFMPYQSIEKAIEDAVCLAKAMSLKTRLGDLNLSGGKAVLMKPKVITDKVAYLKTFGRFVESLNGKFITGCDSGTIEEDIKIMASETQYVSGLSTTHGRDDMSYFTALGVTSAMQAAVKIKFGNDALKDLRVLITGIGKVGYYLAHTLHQLGCKLILSDIVSERAKLCADQLGAEHIEPENIYDIDYEIFAPCALGKIFTASNVDKIPAEIICGSANNQLENKAIDQTLYDHNICYIPDFIASMGGVVYAAKRYFGAPFSEVENYISSHVYSLTKDVCTMSKKQKIPTSFIAQQLATNIGQGRL